MASSLLDKKTPAKLSSLFDDSSSNASTQTTPSASPSRSGIQSPSKKPPYKSPLRTPLSGSRQPVHEPISSGICPDKFSSIFVSSAFFYSTLLITLLFGSFLVQMLVPGIPKGPCGPLDIEVGNRCLQFGSPDYEGYKHREEVGAAVNSKGIAHMAKLIEYFADQFLKERDLEKAINFNENLHAIGGKIVHKLGTRQELKLFGAVFSISFALFTTSFVYRRRQIK